MVNRDPEKIVHDHSPSDPSESPREATNDNGSERIMDYVEPSDANKKKLSWADTWVPVKPWI